MNAIALFRQQLGEAGWLLAETVKDVTPEQAHWAPPGKAHPIGALYAHLATGLDFVVNGMLQGKPPMAGGEWAGKTGLSAPPPAEPGADWSSWARSVRVDLNALGAYAQAALANADAYLGSLTEEGLERKIDFFGLGEQTVAFVVNNAVVSHLRDHCGEISALKGAQGLRGYPY